MSLYKNAIQRLSVSSQTLTWLSVHDNQLTRIRFDALPALEFLSLMNNPLKELNKSVAQLPSLSILRCKGTQIKKLPEGTWPCLFDLECEVGVEPASLAKRFGDFAFAALQSAKNPADEQDESSDANPPQGFFWQFIEKVRFCKRKRDDASDDEAPSAKRQRKLKD